WERWIYTLPLRVRSLFRRREVERELDEELRAHLEQQIRANLARGLGRDEAQHAARRAMGGIEIQKERCRDARRVTFFEDLWEQLRDHQDVFSRAFAWSEQRFDLAQGGAVQYVNGVWVSGGFFEGLGLRPVTGRLLAEEDDRRGCAGAAVISYDFWQSHYGGDQKAIGGSLGLDGHALSVIGVTPRGFYGLEPGSKFDVAIPICTAP